MLCKRKGDFKIINMKNAIICLTRGYFDLQNYKTLINRNKRIYEHIIKKFNVNYPLLIFHEGNILLDHQQYIINQSGNLNIEFIDLSSIWTGGYEAMCRFYMYDIWNYLSNYDYVLRIDEDCYITHCNKDPFSYIGNNVCLKSASWAESHDGTNATLPIFIEKLTMKKSSDFYIHQFPYTNVFLSNISFWLNPEINKILKIIALNPMQRDYRWGDLPVLGSLLNIFAPNQVGYLSEFNYIHASHNNQNIICK